MAFAFAQKAKKPVLLSVKRMRPNQRQAMEDEEEMMQMKPAGGGSAISAVSPDVEAGINSLRGRGQPQTESTRAFMEPRFGHDFSGVRVHTDPQAMDSAQAKHAQAYTMGQDIVFATGQYQLGILQGDRLLAHELTHLRQQSTGQITEVIQQQPNKDEWSSFESIYRGDPRFVFWAKRHGKPPANYGEIVALLDGQTDISKNQKAGCDAADEPAGEF